MCNFSCIFFFLLFVCFVAGLQNGSGTEMGVILNGSRTGVGRIAFYFLTMVWDRDMTRFISVGWDVSENPLSCHALPRTTSPAAMNACASLRRNKRAHPYNLHTAGHAHLGFFFVFVFASDICLIYTVDLHLNEA